MRRTSILFALASTLLLGCASSGAARRNGTLLVADRGREAVGPSEPSLSRHDVPSLRGFHSASRAR